MSCPVQGTVPITRTKEGRAASTPQAMAQHPQPAKLCWEGRWGRAGTRTSAQSQGWHLELSLGVTGTAPAVTSGVTATLLLAPSRAVAAAWHSPSHPKPLGCPQGGQGWPGLRSCSAALPGFLRPRQQRVLVEAQSWQQIRSWVMSCKGKTPKGVRAGGRVSWREQMTPGWSQSSLGGSPVPGVGSTEPSPALALCPPCQ